MENKYEKEISKILGDLLPDDQVNKILRGFMPPDIEGDYEVGDIMTLKELKSLPIDSVIHLKYYDDSGHLRDNDFEIYTGIDNGEANTSTGNVMPISSLSDDDLLESIDNCGWEYTIRKSIKKK